MSRSFLLGLAAPVLISVPLVLRAAPATSPVPATAQTEVASAADTQWQQVTAALDMNLQGLDENRMREIQEGQLLRYRALGLAFYEHFPNDPRRWEWLLRTVRSSPHYWIDRAQGARSLYFGSTEFAPIDITLAESWNKRLQDELKPAFFTSAQVTDEQRASWYWNEMKQVEMRMIEERFRDKKLDAQSFRNTHRQYLQRYTEALVAYAAQPKSDARGFNSTYLLLSLIDKAQVGPEVEQSILDTLKISPNERVRSLAEGLDRRAQLREKPLQLTVTTFEGNKVDLASLRGKIVLFDIWSLYCGSCIDALPKIREVYDKYRSRGFEVVGVALVGKEPDEREKLLQVLEETGGKAWTNAFVSGKDNEDLTKQFAITGVPITWLFARDGRLVARDIHRDDLEEAVKRLIVSAAAP